MKTIKQTLHNKTLFNWKLAIEINRHPITELNNMQISMVQPIDCACETILNFNDVDLIELSYFLDRLKHNVDEIIVKNNVKNKIKPNKFQLTSQ